MKCRSTGHACPEVSFKEAVFQGFAPDGGLYLPKSLPTFAPSQLKNFKGLSLFEISLELTKSLFSEELLSSQLEKVCSIFHTPIPVLSLEENLYLAELFHGPTLSFKDFGAQFMAQLVSAWQRDGETTVLVATSGDTGSAVGRAFHRMPGVRVFILYPKGKVTSLQEQQLTTIGDNVKALQIDGTFEDCQTLLKRAVLDRDLQAKTRVTTANSINIARLFPQAFYYFYVFTQLENQSEGVFSVPCGNFGHLVSGILAKRMGLPIHRFLAVTNINDEIPLFLKSGVFEPHTAYESIAVSMNVGNPSNFPRLLELYGNSAEKMREDLLGVSFTDDEIRQSIREVYEKHGYLMDPHGATSYLALQKYLVLEKRKEAGLFFATAHPSKFAEALQFLSISLSVPPALKEASSQKKEIIAIPADYTLFKSII